MIRGFSLRAALITASAVAALLIVTQLMGDGGTPPAILFLGLVLGLVNGLVATGLILIYRSSRILNFAHSAMGALGGSFTFYLVSLNNWPYPVAFVVGIAVSALVGLLVEVGVIRRFFNAPRLALTVLTIALAGLIVGFNETFLQQLPIFPEDVSPQDLARPLPLPFPSFKFHIGSLPLDFGFGHVFALAMSVLALAGLGYFLRFTRSGVAVRASAENSERAELLGISVKTLSAVVWTIAGALAGLGVILTATVTRFSAVSGLAPAALVPALAIAVIARMRSLAVAMGASIGLSILQQAVGWSYPEQQGLINIAFFGLVLVGLVLQGKSLHHAEASESTTWRATEEIRPTPRELLTVGGLRAWRRAPIAVGAILVLLYPWVTPTGPTNFGGFVAITGIVLLSLVVLTGWAGQVSLGQFALVSVGAVVGGAMTSKLGWPFLLAVPAAALISSGVAVLVGIPALRIKGLFLAVTTFAFAFAVESTLFNERYFGWLLPERVERPTLFLIDFEDERSMYYLSVAAFLLCAAVVSTLRRYRTGRALIGVRENEANMRSFTIRVVQTRLAAFALSGFFCGLAGVLLAHHQRAVSASAFSAQESLEVFLLAVVGGISSVSGTLLAAAYFSLKRFVAGDLSFWVGPFGTLVILYLFPGGLAAMAYALRDTIYRIVAQRKQMVVPALLADYDPSALERKLIPIVPPASDSGLRARLLQERYRWTSPLYAGRGRLLAVIDMGRSKESDEASAFGAAIASLESGEEDGRGRVS